MSGYRRVNFYELCRLCTSSEGDKIHIFRDEGRRRQLPTKIQSCLPLQILEDDSLPKTVCNLCVDKIEEFTSFRQSSVNAEAMLETYFTSLRCSDEYRRSEGKVSNVYVKETNLDQSQEELQEQQEQILPHHHQSQIKADQQHTKATDSVIQVVKTEHTSHHESIHQTSVVTSVAAASSRPLINFVDNHNGTKTLTLPLNVSQQSPIKLSQSNTMVLPVSMEGLQSLVQAGASVQIVQQSESDGTTRLQSYRYIQIPNNSGEGSTTVALVPSNDSRIQFMDSQAEDEQHEEITVHPHETEEEDEEGDEEMQYVQFSGYKEEQRDTRGNISNISEFLRIKSDQAGGGSPPPQQDAHSSLPVESVAMCGNCGAMLMSNDEMTEHMATCKTNVHHQNNGGVLVASNNQDTKDSAQAQGDDANSAPLNYPCDVCSKAFRRKEHLFQHKKLHTGERPFICGTCGKAFSRKEHLLRHGTSHTGQKMHPCDICNKMFSRKDNLHKHRKTHGICGPYVCPYCGKSFVVKHYYLMHVANHNCPESKEAAAGGDGGGQAAGPPFQFRCDICLKTFVSAEFLKNHKSRHRNRKNVQVIQLTRQHSGAGGDENQRHGRQPGEQVVRHIRGGSREDAVIIEPQESHTLVLKQEIQEIDMSERNEEPQDDGDPLSVEPKLPHHTLSSLGGATLIPTTMGTHVIQLPPSYMHAGGDGHIESGDGLLEIVSHPRGKANSA